MQSKYLRKFGFKKWQKFSFENETDLLACLPKGKGVYVIKHKSAFGRLKGKSDIVSFGSTTANEGGLRKRIRFYFHPDKTQKKNLRISRWLKKTTGLSISYVTNNRDQAIKNLERKLRERYEKQHAEFPPWDRKA